MHTPDTASPTTTLSPTDQHRVAHEVAAVLRCDHRTVLRRLRGAPVRGVLGGSIDHELAARRIRTMSPDTLAVTLTVAQLAQLLDERLAEHVPPAVPPALCTRAQLAEQLQCCERTIARLEREGLPRNVRFTIDMTPIAAEGLKEIARPLTEAARVIYAVPAQEETKRSHHYNWRLVIFGIFAAGGVAAVAFNQNLSFIIAKILVTLARAAFR